VGDAKPVAEIGYPIPKRASRAGNAGTDSLYQLLHLLGAQPPGN
jgi:hypothetical protein